MVVIRGRRCHGEGPAREQGHTRIPGLADCVFCTCLLCLEAGALLQPCFQGVTWETPRNSMRYSAWDFSSQSRQLWGITVSISYSRAGSSTSSLQEQLGLYFAHFLPGTLRSRGCGAGTPGRVDGRQAPSRPPSAGHQGTHVQGARGVWGRKALRPVPPPAPAQAGLSTGEAASCQHGLSPGGARFCPGRALHQGHLHPAPSQGCCV